MTGGFPFPESTPPHEYGLNSILDRIHYSRNCRLDRWWTFDSLAPVPKKMKIQPAFISEDSERWICGHVAEALEDIRERHGKLRNRVLRFGFDYEKPSKWLGPVPSWIPSVAGDDHEDADSVTLNEYVKGQQIAPHIDSAAFGDVKILSLLADVTMRFTSPMGKNRDFLLPRRSLAVMSGELRTKWTHETMPLEADLRISIVYRLRIA